MSCARDTPAWRADRSGKRVVHFTEWHGLTSTIRCVRPPRSRAAIAGVYVWHVWYAHNRNTSAGMTMGDETSLKAAQRAAYTQMCEART